MTDDKRLAETTIPQRKATFILSVIGLTIVKMSFRHYSVKPFDMHTVLSL